MEHIDVSEENESNAINLIPKKIVKLIDWLSTVASHFDEWMQLKMALLRMLPNDLQRYFSTRHPKTKLQHPNAMEIQIMNYWVSLTHKKMIYKSDGTQYEIEPK
jgi:hypothetical protein